MAAFYNIQPREAQPNPIMEGAYNVLKLYNDFNDQKKKNQQERIQKIMSLSDKVDFVETLSTANRSEQLNYYNDLNNTLVNIVKQGKNKDGNISVDDYALAQEAIRKYGAEISRIKEDEQWFHGVQQEFLKNSGDYDPNTISETTNAYITKGEKIPPKKKPIMPNEWMIQDDKAFRMGDESLSNMGGNQWGTKVQRFQNDDMRTQAFMNRLMGDPRKVDGLIQDFARFSETKPNEAKKYIDENNGDTNKAALMYGVDMYGKEYLKDYTKDIFINKESSRSKQEIPIVDVSGESGTITWNLGDIKLPFVSQDVYQYNTDGTRGSKIKLTGAKLIKIGVGSLSKEKGRDKGKKEVPYAMFLQPIGDGKTKTVIVPYEDIEESIKRMVNLKGIEKIDPYRIGVYKVNENKIQTSSKSNHTDEEIEKMEQLGITFE